MLDIEKKNENFIFNFIKLMLIDEYESRITI